jgi:hypothetical protein
MLKIFKFFKDLLLFVPITLIFYPFSKLFVFLSYFNKLLMWIYNNKKEFLSSDFYSPFRDYSKRKKLYQFLVDHFELKEKSILYLEFGVASGDSFKWWLSINTSVV